MGFHQIGSTLVYICCLNYPGMFQFNGMLKQGYFMNQQPYDLILTIALFMCGMMGMNYFIESNHSLALGISSSVALLGSIGYMFGMPKYLSLPDRNDNKFLARFICEICQKSSMLAVVAQCFIILASN